MKQLKLVLIFGLIVFFVIIASGCIEYKDGTFSVKFQNITDKLTEHTDNFSSSKTIIPETIDDINIKIKNCGTTAQCDDWFENHVNNNYVSWFGTISDVGDNLLFVSVDYINAGTRQTIVVLHDIDKEDLLKFNKGDKVQFIGKIKMKRTEWSNRVSSGTTSSLRYTGGLDTGVHLYNTEIQT